MADHSNQLINFDDEAKNNVTMSNTVPIASGEGKPKMRENWGMERGRSTWTPTHLHMSRPAPEDRITVIVGPEQAKFQVHDYRLCCSKYFRTILDGQWNEGEDRVIALADLEPDVFELFVKFIYTEMLSGGMNSPWRMSAQELEAEKEPLLASCIKAYALGDRLSAFGFCHNVNNIFELKLAGKFPVATGYKSLVQLAFDILPPGCTILQNLVDTYCACFDSYKERSFVDQPEIPYDFRMRVDHRRNELRDPGMIEVETKRCYLEHTIHSRCPACPALQFFWDSQRKVGIFG